MDSSSSNSWNYETRAKSRYHTMNTEYVRIHLRDDSTTKLSDCRSQSRYNILESSRGGLLNTSSQHLLPQAVSLSLVLNLSFTVCLESEADFNVCY